LSLFLERVKQANAKNGPLLANYVAKYFEDIWLHLKQVKRVMMPGGDIHYVVGNSVFYQQLLPVERLYRDMLCELGFKGVRYDIIRKRNSKKELYEFDVRGTR